MSYSSTAESCEGHLDIAMTPWGLRRRSRDAVHRLTVRAESNFQFSFAFVSKTQAHAIRDVYRWCRAVDDVVDERAPGEAGKESAHAQLGAWRSTLDELYGGRRSFEDPVAEALAETVRRHDLPREALDGIIDGCAMDLTPAGYPSLAQLELYAYRVASCVGFALLPIFGDRSPPAKNFAHRLGLAMQYTNILRDVREDASQGRIYLPRNLMDAAGVSEDDLHAGVWTPQFAVLGRRFGDVAREYYRLAWRSLGQCEKRRRLAGAEIMGRTYERLLTRIEDENWDVFHQRLGVKRREKLAIAARVLARPQLVSP